MVAKQLDDKMRSTPIKSKGNKKIVDLVTGATSGIGRVLINKLISEGHEVRVIVKEHPNKDPEWKSLPAGVKPYKVDIELNDKRDEKELMSACKGVDNLFHAAGASYNYKYTYTHLININVIATENILNAFVKSNPKTKNLHFIYLSSVTVYGYRRKNEILTEDSELRPKSKYSQSKILAEQVVKSFLSVNSNLKCSIMRFGIFYGDHYKGSFFKIFRLVYEGRMTYINHGMNHLTLIDVEDAADSLLLVLNDEKSDTYNVVEGSYTVRELAEFIAKKLNVKKPKMSIPYVVGRITRKIANVNIDEFEFITSDRIVSIDKIKRELGFEVKHNIKKKGLEMLDEFMRKNNRTLKR